MSAGIAPGWQAHPAALQAWLLHGEPGMHPRVAGHGAHERAHRLRIYADAYRLRLLQILAEDYPALRARCGPARFDRLAARYLVAHPSRSPSVRWLGAAFADWLRTDGQPPSRVALARFEWAKGEVFDAADAVALDQRALLELGPAQWPRLRLALAPSLRLLAGLGNAPQLAAALAAGGRAPRWRADPGRHWLLWRHEHDVYWRALDADEAAALQAIAAGACFADWCVRLHHEQPALRAAGLLKRWLADGWISALSIASAAEDIPSTL